MNTTTIMEEIRKRYAFVQKPLKSAVAEDDATIGAKTGESVLANEDKMEEGVELQLSEEGKQKMEEARKQREAERLKEWAEQMKEDNENAAEHADDTAKIMTIFRRIANGDIVPSKDETKLMEHSMEMYQAAKNLACLKQNVEKKKYKSVDEDEEENSGAISQEEAIRALADSGSSENASISGAESTTSFEVV